MADLHVQVPQHVERGFDDVLDGGRHLPRRDEQQVDIGERRHLAASVAADRHHRHALALGGQRVGVQVGLGHAGPPARGSRSGGNRRGWSGARPGARRRKPRRWRARPVALASCSTATAAPAPRPRRRPPRRPHRSARGRRRRRRWPSSGTMSVPGSVAIVRRGFRSETGTAKASWGGVNDGHLVFDHLGDRQRPLVGAVGQQAEHAAGALEPGRGRQVGAADAARGGDGLGDRADAVIAERGQRVRWRAVGGGVSALEPASAAWSGTVNQPP
jgi:hypothetical protein